MRWLRFLFSALLVSGLSAFAYPEVANADSLDLMGSSNVAFFDHNFTNATDSQAEDDWFSAHLGYGQQIRTNFVKYAYYPLIYRSETLMNGSLSGTQTITGSTTGTGNSTGTISGQYNGSQIGGTSSYVSGQSYGSYDNPNSVLGDDLGYGDTYSETGSGSFNTTETGYISGSTSSGVNYSERNTGSGSYSGSSNSTGYTEYYYSFSMDNYQTMDFTGLTGSRAFALKMQGFSDQVEGTAIDVANMADSITIINADGTKNFTSSGGLRPKVFVRNTITGEYVKCQRVDGHYIAPVGFSQICVVNRFSTNAQMDTNVREIRFPSSFHVYINYDYTYNNTTNTTITSTTQQQTYDIGQQTQQQTNQLKDTTGSDSIVGSAQSAGDNIVNRLGFVTQTANFVTSSFNAISNASASSTVRFPRVAFQNYTIIEQQDVPLLGYLPSEVETTLRTFGTLLFTLVWINGLKRMYDKIFGGEKVVEVEDE